MASTFRRTESLPQTNLSSWYHPSDIDQSIVAPAQSAFLEGLENFKRTLIKGSEKEKRLVALQPHSLQDVLVIVTEAQSRYERDRTLSKARSILTSFSKRVHLYAKVVDVFAQHHPEYVSLAWGLMKLIVGGIVEHDRVNVTLLEVLTDFTTSLPQIELAVTLYATPLMLDAVARLYSCIIKLLLRALKWYEEGRLLHAVHAFTQPVALRYHDLIIECQSHTKTVNNLAHIGSQAEVRDIHKKLLNFEETMKAQFQTWTCDNQVVKDQVSNLTRLFEQIRDGLATDRLVATDFHLGMKNQLSDIQLVQALSHISTQCSIDHKAALNKSMSYCDRQPLLAASTWAPLCASSRLQEWNESTVSSSVFLKATYKDRAAIRSFCVAVIRQLLSTTTTVLYVLRDPERVYTLHDILKSLILQSLSLSNSSQGQTSGFMTAQGFHNSHTDEDYLNLLGRNLERFEVVFIIVNAEAMEPDTALQCRVALRDLSRKLIERQAKTVLRILNTSQSPRYPADVTVDDEIVKLDGMHARRGYFRGGSRGSRFKTSTGTSDLFAIVLRQQKRQRIR